MLTALKTYWHAHTLGVRETFRDLYRHYKLERDLAKRQFRFEPRSHDDEIILAAIARAKEAQLQQALEREQDVERQVRRFAEAARFLTRSGKKT